MLLHEDEGVFRSFIRWMPFLDAFGLDSLTCVRLCCELHRVWKTMEIPLMEFADKVELLSKHSPKAFVTAICDCQTKNQDDLESTIQALDPQQSWDVVLARSPNQLSCPDCV